LPTNPKEEETMKRVVLILASLAGAASAADLPRIQVVPPALDIKVTEVQRGDLVLQVEEFARIHPDMNTMRMVAWMKVVDPADGVSVRVYLEALYILAKSKDAEDVKYSAPKETR
jgi:hypothetical protein